jgi:hypothetical protein
VVLITRMETGWTTYEQVGGPPFGVGFKDLCLDELPLGGVPIFLFLSRTYLMDGRGKERRGSFHR